MNAYQTPPAWKDATDRLSRTISEILIIFRQLELAYQDMQAFNAPSECGRDISRSAAKAIKETLKRNGYTADDLIAEAEERTNARFIYNLGLPSLMEWSE